METHRRGSDGRRVFTADFKREQIERVLRGSITPSELSRELSVSPSVVRRWKHLAERGSRALCREARRSRRAARSHRAAARPGTRDTGLRSVGRR